MWSTTKYSHERFCSNQYTWPTLLGQPEHWHEYSLYIFNYKRPRVTLRYHLIHSKVYDTMHLMMNSRCQAQEFHVMFKNGQKRNEGGLRSSICPLVSLSVNRWRHYKSYLQASYTQNQLSNAFPSPITLLI